MCYFIHGAVNKETNPKDLEKLLSGSGFFFKACTKHAIKESISNGSDEFCIRESICDCDFPMGKGSADALELQALSKTLEKLRAARGVKCAYIAKVWAGKAIKSEHQVHIDDIDVSAYLAEAIESCLYRIDLYQRHESDLM